MAWSRGSEHFSVRKTTIRISQEQSLQETGSPESNNKTRVKKPGLDKFLLNTNREKQRWWKNLEKYGYKLKRVKIKVHLLKG